MSKRTGGGRQESSLKYRFAVEMIVLCFSQVTESWGLFRAR